MGIELKPYAMFLNFPSDCEADRYGTWAVPGFYCGLVPALRGNPHRDAVQVTAQLC